MASDELPQILIADDDEDDRFILRRTLEKADVHNPVVVFDDGDDLLDFLGDRMSAPPCLLFLDLNMPRMTGFDVLSALRQRGLGGIATVVVSGSARDEDRDRAKALGACGYLVKFPPPTQLAEIVQVMFRDAQLNRSRCASARLDRETSKNFVIQNPTRAALI